MVRSIQTLDPKELRSHLVRELEQIRERQISVLPLVFRSHLFGLVRLGRGGVHVRSDT